MNLFQLKNLLPQSNQSHNQVRHFSDILIQV